MTTICYIAILFILALFLPVMYLHFKMMTSGRVREPLPKLPKLPTWPSTPDPEAQHRDATLEMILSKAEEDYLKARLAKTDAELAEEVRAEVRSARWAAELRREQAEKKFAKSVKQRL